MKEILCVNVSRVLRAALLAATVPSGLIYFNHLLLCKAISDTLFFGLWSLLLLFIFSMVFFDKIEELSFNNFRFRLRKAAEEADETLNNIKRIEQSILTLLLAQAEEIPGAMRNIGAPDERINGFLKVLATLPYNTKNRSSADIERICVNIAWSQLDRLAEINGKLQGLISNKPRIRESLPSLSELAAIDTTEVTDHGKYIERLGELRALYLHFSPQP